MSVKSATTPIPLEPLFAICRDYATNGPNMRSATEPAAKTTPVMTTPTAGLVM
jgi:hypothetical protein